MNANTKSTMRSNKRFLAAATAMVLVLGITAPAHAAVLTLQDMFDGGSFSQDGLTFSGFSPALSTNLPSAQMLNTLVLTNPSALLATPVIDDQAGQFSESWGNAQAANAANIGLEVLPDDTGTPGVDPGFRLNSASEWTVNAGNLASAQLSAFAYTVTTAAQPINSAGILQESSIDAIGPDLFSLNPMTLALGLPDVAFGFALQFVLDPSDILLAQNITLRGGVRTATGVEEFSQLDVWSSFADQSEVRVISVFGVGASSEGGFTMNALEQRIDPPPPGGVPIPGTLLLVGIGLVAIRYRLSRIGA